MELTLQTNKSALFIKNYEDSCLYIADKVYDHNIVIVENIISKWNIDNISNLKLDDFEDIVNTKPEIIIIGTGKEPIIPKLEIIKKITNENSASIKIPNDLQCFYFKPVFAGRSGDPF